MRLSPLPLALVLLGCNHMPDQAAVLDMPSAASRAELEAVLTQALGQREILLAPDALTRSSVLTLEASAAQSDPVAGGRNLGMPERFDLVLSGGQCLLVHAGTGNRYPLEQATCVPAVPE